jgi:hypothetical protein
MHLVVHAYNFLAFLSLSRVYIYIGYIYSFAPFCEHAAVVMTYDPTPGASGLHRDRNGWPPNRNGPCVVMHCACWPGRMLLPQVSFC